MNIWLLINTCKIKICTSSYWIEIKGALKKKWGGEENMSNTCKNCKYRIETYNDCDSLIDVCTIDWHEVRSSIESCDNFKIKKEV